MEYLSLAIISLALSLEYFSISQRFTFFLNKDTGKYIIVYLLWIIVIQAIYTSIGSGLHYLIFNFFPINDFWFSLIIIGVLSVKYFGQTSAKLHIKKTINPVIIRNLIGLFMAAGLNILIGSIALSCKYNYWEIFSLLVVISVFVSFLGFFYGHTAKKLLDLKLELFSSLLLFGEVVKNVIDYFILS